MLEREGEGWRLAWDSQRSPFPLLIGGQGWATEFTAAEGLALQRALEMVSRQHHDLVDTLMEEEAIALEFHGSVIASDPTNSGTLWLALEGDRKSWSLRFVLQPPGGQRAVEGAWTVGAAEALTRACLALDWSAVTGLEGPNG